MALTNDDLLAISQLLDLKLDSKLKPIEERLAQVENIASDMQERVKKVEIQTNQTELLLEHDISPRLQNIESCYTSTYQRYASGADHIEALQADMEIIKKIVQEHSEKLKEIS